MGLGVDVLVTVGVGSCVGVGVEVGSEVGVVVGVVEEVGIGVFLNCLIYKYLLYVFKERSNKNIISHSTKLCINNHSIAYLVISSMSLYGKLVGLVVIVGVTVLVKVGVAVGDWVLV